MSRKTALFDVHSQLGAKMVEFAGWVMAVRYLGIRQEHLAVRKSLGLFDISHMGEIELKGRDAAKFCQWLTTNDLAGVREGRAQYTLLCNPNGGVVDDVIVNKFSDEHIFICVNSVNTQKDYGWLVQNSKGFDVEILDTSDEYSQLALQGPRSAKVLSTVLDSKIAELKSFQFSTHIWNGSALIVSRTGYTGEDGFEIFLSWADGPKLWETILQVGAEDGILPSGLGARDTLRLEKAYPLYGHELDEETTPFEAGLSRFVKIDSGDFIGREALKKQLSQGLKKSLFGFIMFERGVPRQGYKVFTGDVESGQVTSGTLSPSLGKSIGLCFIKSGIKLTDNPIEVEVHKRRRKAEVVDVPFVKKR